MIDLERYFDENPYWGPAAPLTSTRLYMLGPLTGPGHTLAGRGEAHTQKHQDHFFVSAVTTMRKHLSKQNEKNFARFMRSYE